MSVWSSAVEVRFKFFSLIRSKLKFFLLIPSKFDRFFHEVFIEKNDFARSI